MGKFCKSSLLRDLEAMRQAAKGPVQAEMPSGHTWGALSTAGDLPETRAAFYAVGRLYELNNLCGIVEDDAFACTRESAEQLLARRLKAHKRKYEKATGRSKMFNPEMGVEQCPETNLKGAMFVGRAKLAQEVLALLEAPKFGRGEEVENGGE